MLEASLYAYLSGQTAITNLVSTRIYPHHRPQGDSLPAISFRSVSKPHVHNLDGSAGTAKARVQIDSWASDLATAITLAESLRLVLQGFRGDLEGTVVGACLLDSETCLHEANEGSEYGTYHIASDFLFLFNEEIPS